MGRRAQSFARVRLARRSRDVMALDAAHQVIAADIALKLVAGLALLVAPVALARICGLPHGNSGLWPRLLGAVLLGLAGAMYAEVRLDTARGLGIVGAIIVNLSAVAVLLALAALVRPPARRGAAVLWGAALLLLLVSLAQILAA